MNQSERTVKKSDFQELMGILSVPRPNGSRALNETRKQLSAWLDAEKIPHHLHKFRLYPYFLEIGGIWLLVTQSLLAYSIWARWGWVSLLIAIVSIGVSVLETRGIPILSWLVSDVGENIVIEFEPKVEVRRELILSAHYDSKTELLSERWVNYFMGKLPLGMGLSLLLGVLGVMMSFSADSVTSTIYPIAAFLTIPMFIIFLPLCTNFIFGQFGSPSQGAVDNGAATAILFDVASKLAVDRDGYYTKVSIVIFCGEETIVQGSRAYVRDRNFPYPTQAVNLELMGQNGDYVIWNKIGDPFGSFPTDSDLNQQLDELVKQHSGNPITFLDAAPGTDTLPFLQAGIPATSLASLDNVLGFGGLHRPIDSLARVEMSKLPEGSEMLIDFVKCTDAVAS